MQATSEAPQLRTEEIALSPRLFSGEELFRYLRREGQGINDNAPLAIELRGKRQYASLEIRKESMTVRIWDPPVVVAGRQTRQQAFSFKITRHGQFPIHDIRSASVSTDLKEEAAEAILETLIQRDVDLVLNKLRAMFQKTIEDRVDEPEAKTCDRQEEKLSKLLDCDPFHKRHLGTHNLGIVLYVLTEKLLSKMESVTEPLLFQEVKRSVSRVEWGVTEPRFSQTWSNMRQSGILQEVSSGRFRLHPSWQGLADTPEIQSVQDLLS